MRMTFLLPGIRQITGGISTIFEIASRLAQRGHKAMVVYPIVPLSNGHPWYHFGRQVSRLKGALGRLIHRNRVSWFDLKAELIRVPTLHERFIPQADIIVATWWANAHDINRYAVDKGKKVYFIQAYESWAGPEEMVDRSYRLPLYKLAVSTSVKRVIEEKFGVSVLATVPNGVNSDLFYKERKTFKGNIPRRIGMVYRKVKLKGMADGFKAFFMAKERHANIKLVLFGEPKGEAVPDIAEHHVFPHSDRLRKLYNSLDIFVLPSHHEGFAKSPMEAMACGAACVLTDVGGVRDYTIPDETAIVVPPKRPDKLAEGICALLEDEAKREKIARRGYEYIQKFTWDRPVDQLEKIFEKILAVSDTEKLYKIG